MPTRSVPLAVVPGDGIGPEVVTEGVKVLSAAAARHDVTLETTEYDLGAGRWHATGETLPDTVAEELRGHEAILLGAVGDPSVPSGVLERGLLLRLRFDFAHYVNLRPVKLYPGVHTPLADAAPDDIDMLVVREGTEGPYAGMGGVLRKDTPGEIATQDSVNTRFGVERVVRYAFAKAQARPARRLTLVHKDNVLTYAGELWQRVVREVGAQYPDVAVDYCHVDAATMFFVSQPERFDVVVTDNLFGDIITDLGAAIAGGIGLAASGNINPQREFPSMFEPVHGSAPDIAGQGVADPTATVLSGAAMLEHLGLEAAARQVEAAVAEDLRARAESGSQRSTERVGDDLAKRVVEQG
ncbi:3-isopropylmalate dehydrogenase [Haloactinospora alba]|uniref:3-isopropylmalate dehydrogenase n=1 Tax=Haloactinospora alba TaxID=405555 RepID=A0A543NGD8_9ACTN|nr:3-isopropylmalate dehydrogenase [Haloactinospora alba]TQN30872.1 3-isopropylmalate dehydrogenase [Haloactinospora alba]